MFSNMGIRARLLIAFFGISTFAVLAAAAALYSFFAVGKVLDTISTRHTPEAILSLELSRQAERVVSAASALLNVESSLQREQVRSKTAVEGERLQELIARLKRIGGDDSLVATIDWTAKQLIGNLQNINTHVGDRLQMIQRRDVLWNDAREAIAIIKHLLTLASIELESKLEKARSSKVAVGGQSQNWTELLISTRTALLRAGGYITSLHDIVLESRNMDDIKVLSQLSVQVRVVVDALNDLIGGLDASLAAGLKPEVAKLINIAQSDSGLFAQLTGMSRIAANARDVMIENSWLAGELSGNVDDLVARAKSKIITAIINVNESQSFSIFVVLAVVALSLIVSTLIVWLYVGRNIIARLTALSTAMESVAGGDLRIDLPESGTDEIGHMVDALTIFRDTAIEIEENNLREIGQARQRLVDAIESISEGFCYFDADDKLIVANKSYREMVQIRGGQTVKEGMTFEALARTAAEGGYVEDARGRVEEWIAERIEQHRHPGQPHIQQRGDLWMMISERRTGDGGTVAVYSDITELKQREEALAGKSRSMEQLSKQISKYLSPQVYDSIFTGKQEVKVASHRRKLTVFFSDIAGFTETADQMESEDLTKILNHYLTEMTQIAIAYGATIDKYVGDAIVIFFGDPESRGVTEDALACVRMAIAMRERMVELQDTWRQSGVIKPLQIRIGINTGFCTVGNFGSEARMDYTIIGSGVNLASRLESAATPGEILVSYETYAAVKNEIRCRDMGELIVRGLAYPAKYFEVIDANDNREVGPDLIVEEHSNFALKLDIAVMTRQEQDAAEKILNRALRTLDYSRKTDVAAGQQH
jgi:adenylate cyclase